MKIICETMAEYDDLMSASKHLHDYSVCKKDFKGLKRGEVIGVGMDRFPTINFLAHLYLTTEDFPDKFEVILIEEEKTTKEKNND